MLLGSCFQGAHVLIGKTITYEGNNKGRHGGGPGGNVLPENVWLGQVIMKGNYFVKEVAFELHLEELEFMHKFKGVEDESIFKW